MKFDKEKFKATLLHPNNKMFITEEYLELLDELVKEYKKLMAGVKNIDEEEVCWSIHRAKLLSPRRCMLCSYSLEEFNKRFSEKTTLAKTSECSYCIHSYTQLAVDNKAIEVRHNSCIPLLQKRVRTPLSFPKELTSEVMTVESYIDGGYGMESKKEQKKIDSAFIKLCESRIELWEKVIAVIEEIQKELNNGV